MLLSPGAGGRIWCALLPPIPPPPVPHPFCPLASQKCSLSPYFPPTPPLHLAVLAGTGTGSRAGRLAHMLVPVLPSYESAQTRLTFAALHLDWAALVKSFYKDGGATFVLFSRPWHPHVFDCLCSFNLNKDACHLDRPHMKSRQGSPT